MSRPLLAAHRLAHTPTTPTRAREHQPKGAGVARHYCPTPQASAHTKARKHHKRTRTVAQTPNPATREQTRPQQASASTPPSEHKERAHTNTCGHTKCERGNPRTCRGDRHERSADPRRGHAGQRTQQARKQPGLRTVCACARKGGQRERRPLTIAHARARGLSVFVGVFADVCRRFWLVGFGGLGVFWGCLACFLVF